MAVVTAGSFVTDGSKVGKVIGVCCGDASVVWADDTATWTALNTLTDIPAPAITVNDPWRWDSRTRSRPVTV